MPASSSGRAAIMASCTDWYLPAAAQRGRPRIALSDTPTLPSWRSGRIGSSLNTEADVLGLLQSIKALQRRQGLALQ